jgi:peptidoglycan hydrolase-like protein with peptidoglycan-binding domain
MVLSRRFALLVAMLAVAVVAGLATLAERAPSAEAQDKDFNVGCSGKGCWPSYSFRDEDTDVIAAQYLLRSRGFSVQPSSNGFFTSQTTAAVKAFQRSEGLRATGAVNGPTWRALIRTVRFGDRGDAVTAVQVELSEQYNYDLPITGSFGNETRAAVRDFQQKRNLKVTGVVNAATWQKIISVR